ncbi:HesA/MoeB/ThiF family protein [Paracoccus spongiarum]|uniref:ThiF family adenylyltransferase n=1 Tax=Paracoccus spongiarum TaxID=3064387 RepID=A0ABT9JJ31_9RHOB|nr:ThiF family adenylyltransferase [Paracoccus sp. 2205BS29-5]MDP5309062.1 ThiF family adenylyltransferase [Paracoccus sp. 2205BS29-5]
MISYERQNRIEHLTVAEVATVLGAGGLGTWVAYLLALSGVAEIHIFTPELKVRDFDVARFPFPANAIGSNRGEALKIVIESIRPDCKVVLNERFQHNRDEKKLSGAVFNCAADTNDFDETIYTYCQDNGLNYVTGGYEGAAGGVAVGPHLAVPPQPEPVPSWPPVLSFVASMMVHAAFVRPFSFFGTPDSLDVGLEKARTLSRPGMAR